MQQYLKLETQAINLIKWVWYVIQYDSYYINQVHATAKSESKKFTGKGEGKSIKYYIANTFPTWNYSLYVIYFTNYLLYDSIAPHFCLIYSYQCFTTVF